jgi:phage terminase large subunit-like protein
MANGKQAADARSKVASYKTRALQRERDAVLSRVKAMFFHDDPEGLLARPIDEPGWRRLVDRQIVLDRFAVAEEFDEVPEGAVEPSPTGTRAERAIRFIERHCVLPEGPLAGQPMILEEFEKAWIRDVFDNPNRTELAILSMAKKNGKTALIAALLLVFVVGPESQLNSQIVSGAMEREQAALIMNYAAKIVELSPTLTRLVRTVSSRKRIFGLARLVEFRALAAVGKSTHGISPLVAILDEIGQIKGPKSLFVDAVLTAQGAYDDALLIVISTQAADDADLLSTWIDSARENPNPHTVCHVYEAPKDCALDDEAAWKAANPGLGTFRSLSDMRKLAEKAKQLPSFASSFRNLNLNQRVETQDPFAPRDVWDKGARALVPHDGIAPVYGGLDLSAIADLTAWVSIWYAGGQWNVAASFWTPEVGVAEREARDKVPYSRWIKEGYLLTTPGATVDYDFVAAEILEMTQDMNLKAIAFDRWRIESFKAALARRDAPPSFVELMRPFGQGFQSMAPALDTLETHLSNGLLAHAGNPVLKMCAANAIALRDPSGNRKLDKSRKIGRIDGMVALAMAEGIANAPPSEGGEPKFQMFFA